MVNLKQKETLAVLQNVLSGDPNPQKRQSELEKHLMDESKSNNLTWMPYSENQVIFDSKKKALGLNVFIAMK